MSALKRLQSHLKSPVKTLTSQRETRSKKVRQREESVEEELEVVPKSKKPAETMQNVPQPGTSKAATGVNPKTSSAPVGSNQWVKAKTKNQKKNEKNRARKQRKQIQGPLHPYSFKIWADVNGDTLSLATWRILLAKTKENLMKMLLDDINKKVDISKTAVDEYKFIEHRVAKEDGSFEKTSNLPPEDRKGHGLVLSFTREGKEMALRAFNATGVDPTNNRPNITIDSAPVDTRAVYSFAIEKFSWKALIANDGLWHICHYLHPEVIPNVHLNEIKTVNPCSFSEELVIIAVAVNGQWEKAIDKLNGTLRIPFGTLKLKKRRKGAAPPEEDGDATGDEMN